MTQILYRIEEYCTSGWELIEPHQVQLTKEQCKESIELYLAQGYNPSYLRVLPDNESKP
jgi:hypothetical protein